MPEGPSGAVAFLFTDLEASTRLWEEHPETMPAVYARHDAVLREAAAAHAGVVYKVIGDAFQIAFPTAAGALAAAVAAQRALLAAAWPIRPPPLVRMALHLCEVAPEPDGDYRTPGLNRLGRLLSAAHGGQILLSEAIVEALRGRPPDEVELRDLGEHRFRDLSPQRVFAVAAPGLPDAFPPPRGLDRHRHNLPPPPTAFVGRAEEIAAVRRMLAEPGVRVVTLLGPGGIGKTRLALEVAAGLVEELADGVWFVPLASLSDPALVVPTIARTLGVREAGDQTPAEALAEFLRSRATLLLLDNLEQVIDAAAGIAALVAACPGLKLLTTSRAPLRIAGEREFAVPPLPVPAEPLGTPAAAMAAATGGAAVRLFVERARAVRPDFALTAENAAAVAAICRRLDGLPLAIELAAARSRLLPPPQLLRRLERRLPFLTGGPRDRPARQQTLRGAIDWSHDLLDPAGRALFARLAVFAGGAPVEAVEAVCADDGPGDLPPEAAFDALERLAEQSLLRLEEAAGGEPRVAMLETIREYAAERLRERGEAEALARRHAAYFLAFAEAAEPELTGPDQAAWLDRLEAEHDNLRAALAELERAGRAGDQLRLAGALWRFWWVRGYWTEGRDRLTRALARAEGDAAVPPADRALALDGAGVLAEAQGDIERAVALHEAALALRRAAGDRLGAARSLENLGLIELHDRGNAARARGFHEAALTLYRAVDDRAGIAAALANLGDVALAEEKHDRAGALFAESMAMARELGDARGVAVNLNNLGALAFFREERDRAVALYEEGLALWRELGDAQGIALALGNLGEALQHRGESARAAPLYRESLTLCEDLGDKQGVAFALSHLAQVARAEGDAAAAEAHFRRAAALCRRVGDVPRLAECVEGLAGVASGRGEAERAARLFGAAAALREAAEAPIPAVHRPAYERDVAAARAALDPATFAAAWAAGQALDLDELVDALADERLPVAAGEIGRLSADDIILDAATRGLGGTGSVEAAGDPGVAPTDPSFRPRRRRAP